MPLVVQGPRSFSPLERDAFDLVFWDSINVADLEIQIVESLEGAFARYDRANRRVRIAANQFPHTDNLNTNSYRGNTDEFKPGNMWYLNTLIHECTHDWQAEKNLFMAPLKGEYSFTREDLLSLFLGREQHASAAATWFVIGWQLQYSSNDVNLTTWAEETKVGTVNRYRRIHNIPHSQAEPRQRILSQSEAVPIANDFVRLLNHLREA